MFQKFVHTQLWHAHQAAYLVDVLDCAQKSVSLHLSWLQWLVIYQSFSPLKPAALNNFHDLKLDIFIEFFTHTHMKFPFHCNHIFQFMIPEHTLLSELEVPFFTSTMFVPLVARHWNPNSTVSNPSHITYLSMFNFLPCAFHFMCSVTLNLCTLYMFAL